MPQRLLVLRSPITTLLVVVSSAITAIALPVGSADSRKNTAPRVFHPAGGAYHHLWLTFDGGAEPIEVFVALRGGASTTAWFLSGAVPGGVKAVGAHRVLVDAHQLTQSGDRLQGTISLRQVSIWAPMQLLAQVALSIDAKNTGSGFLGTWTSAVAGGKKASGKLSGVLQDEKAIRSVQAFAPGADWPNYHGPYSANRAADSTRSLIDDLALAKPVWRAEERVLSGWGTGVDSRYTRRAALGTVCGGSGTPVFADGRIYLFHYAPAGEPHARIVEKVIADFEATYKRKPLPEERAALVDYCRPFAETIVTCLDARTGEVLWRVTFPSLSGNYQTHKWRGINPTASVMGSVIIANDLANNWVGLNAVNGKVLWTIKSAPKVLGDRAALGAVQAGALAILPSCNKDPVRGVDPKTGKVIWEQPGGPQVLVWGKAGAERVLLLGRTPLACHDAATGKLLWTLEENVIGNSGSAALIEGEMLVGHILPDPKKRGGFFQGWKLSDGGATRIWQDAFLPLDENLTVTLGNGKAYVVGKNEIRCLEIATGKLVGKRLFDPKSHPIGSNQWLALVGDRLLLSPEGQHGKQSLRLLDAGSSLQQYGTTWSPPNNHTTAYAVHPLAFPVVDGRLFVRGMDGLYCYDLRKPAPVKSKTK